MKDKMNNTMLIILFTLLLKLNLTANKKNDRAKMHIEDIENITSLDTENLHVSNIAIIEIKQNMLQIIIFLLLNSINFIIELVYTILVIKVKKFCYKCIAIFI